MGNKSAKLAAVPTVIGPLGSATEEDIVKAIMDIVQQKLIHEAHAAVEGGDRLFTSAILRKEDLSEVVISRDLTKTKNPTAITELNTIEKFYELNPEVRPKAEDCIFLSVYEPTSVALCNIAVAGFDNFIYLFPRELVPQMDGIQEPSLMEIFGIQDEKYQATNKYWIAFSLSEIMENLDNKQEYAIRMEAMKGKFQDLVKTVTAALVNEEQQGEAGSATSTSKPKK